MPEVINLVIKASASWMDDPQSARTVASGEVFWPPWSEGQDRQLDREIYDALSAGGITNFRNHIKHNFGHDEGVSGLESWDVVVHIAEITTAGVIVQYVLPQLIRILKPGGHLPEAEASSVDKEELSLEEARAIATEQVRSSSQLLNIDDPPITENLVGAIRTCMGVCGAQTIAEFHEAELVVAPSIKTEGKVYQLSR